MPFDLQLTKNLRANGWKVKIREKERVEPPHVTIMHKADEWRLGLRDRELLVPPGGRIKDIDPAVMRIIDENWQQLIEAWDAKYPENPSRAWTTRTKTTRMKTTTERARRFVVIGSAAPGLRRATLPPSVRVRHGHADIDEAVASADRWTTWLSCTASSTDLLLDRTVRVRTDSNGSRLITLAPPRAESVPALLGLFHPVVGVTEGSRWLDLPELIEAITAADAADRLVGGSVDRKAKTLTLIRGDITAIVAPFAIFAKSGDRTAPDFTRLRLTDYGRTIALGAYEASADAVLYELDADYRRRLSRQLRERERTLGAALLRLRKQRRLKQTDFAPISGKEIARIERNEVARPHLKTLEVIANRLGVRPEEIHGF